MRELNGNNLSKLNKNKFASNSSFTAYGCWVGGDKSWSDSQIIAFSFAQRIANHLSISVNAFTGSAEFKSTGGKPNFDGTMIRSYDKKSQKTRLSNYNKGKKPTLSR